MIKAILKPFKFIFKAIKFVVMLPINLVKFVLSKVWAVIKYVLNLVLNFSIFCKFGIIRLCLSNSAEQSYKLLR